MASFIFMQPGEQKGSYKHRSVTVTASQIEERGYINLDHMTNGGEKSLKWGAHAYCGRVKAPLGVTIKAFKNWDASGSPAKTIVGRGMRRAVDFWDYHNRMCSFRVEPPVKVIRIKMSARNLMSKDTASGTMKFDQKVSVGCTRNQSTATKIYAEVAGKVSSGCAEATAKAGTEMTSSFSMTNTEAKEIQWNFEMPPGSPGYVYQMDVETWTNTGEYCVWACNLKMTDKPLRNMVVDRTFR